MTDRAGYADAVRSFQATPVIAELIADRRNWRLVSDRVMGGVSSGQLEAAHYQGRDCLHLYGAVSTENNGGFIQMSYPVSAHHQIDPSDYAGLSLIVAGNAQQYNIHLRTSDLSRPWESYRSSFTAAADWQEIRVLFSQFEPYRTSQPFDLKKLERIGLVAIGRDFEADLHVNSLQFIRGL